MADDFAAAAFLGEDGSVTHALLAHERATEAADAASLEEAREKHLGAAKNFLASAEDCGDESTKKALLLLSRGHARAAMQISERMRSGMDPAVDGGSLTSLAEDRPAVSQSTSVKAETSLLQQPQRVAPASSRAKESSAQAGQTKPVPDSSAGGVATKEFLALERVLARFGARPLRRKDHSASSMAESLSASVSMMGSSALYKSCAQDTGRGGLLGESFVLPPPSGETANGANGSSRRLAGGLPTPRSLRESLTLSSINEAHERRQDQLFRVRTDDGGGTGTTGQSQSTERQQLGQSVITSAVTAGHGQDVQHSQAQRQRQRHKQGSSGGGRFIPSQEHTLQQAELIRCLKTTQLLHDENAKLLDVNQELREKLKAAQDVDVFKAEYSRIFKKVKEELLKFREAYPHLKNPAATVPNAAEKQLRQLHLAYEKKANKLKESEGGNLKLQRRVHQYEKKLKQYEAAFRKLSERVALKRANAHSEDKGREGDARRRSIENREQLVRASNSTQRREREQLKPKQQRVQARDQQVQQLRRQTSPAGVPNAQNNC